MSEMNCLILSTLIFLLAATQGQDITSPCDCFAWDDTTCDSPVQGSYPCQNLMTKNFFGDIGPVRKHKFEGSYEPKINRTIRIFNVNTSCIHESNADTILDNANYTHAILNEYTRALRSTNRITLCAQGVNKTVCDRRREDATMNTILRCFILSHNYNDLEQRKK